MTTEPRIARRNARVRMRGSRPIIVARASDMPLPIDEALSDPNQIGGELATWWRRGLRTPRWMMLDKPSQEFLRAWVLIQPGSFRYREGPELRGEFGGISFHGIRMMAVRAEDRMLMFLYCRSTSDLADALQRPLEGMDGRRLFMMLASRGAMDVMDSVDALALDDSAGLFGAECDSFRRAATNILTEALAVLGITGRQAHATAEAVCKRERTLQQKAFTALRRLLDLSVAQAVEEVAGRLTPRIYNWVVAASSGQSRLRRLQALAAYPALISGTCAAPQRWMAFALDSPMARAREHDAVVGGAGPVAAWLAQSLKVPKDSPMARARELDAVVEDGAPLAAWLADSIEVPRNVVRTLHGVLPEQLPVTNIRLAARLIALVAPEKRPRDKAEWSAFDNFVREVAALEESWKLGEDIAAAYPGVQVSLGKFARRGWCASWERYCGGHRLTRNLADTRDIRESVHRMTAFLKTGSEARLIQTMLAMDMDALQRFSERWHLVLAREMAEQSPVQSADEPAWEPLLEGGMACDGFQIVALTSPQELRGEGRRMGHCVSLYAENCLLGRSHVLSIRNRQGKSCSTLEIELKERGDQFMPTVRQHVGPRNRPAPDECQQVARVLLDRLNQPDAQEWFSRLESARLDRRALVLHWLGRDDTLRSQAELRALKEVAPWICEGRSGATDVSGCHARALASPDAI